MSYYTGAEQWTFGHTVAGGEGTLELTMAPAPTGQWCVPGEAASPPLGCCPAGGLAWALADRAWRARSPCAHGQQLCVRVAVPHRCGHLTVLLHAPSISASGDPGPLAFVEKGDYLRFDLA